MTEPLDITTREGLVQTALDAAQVHSDMQFRLGYLALVARDYYSMTYVEFAKEINMASSTLSEYALVVDFFSDKGLPNNLRIRIEDLHERRRDGIVRYTHFRLARSIGRKDTTLDRVAQVEAAVSWLEARLDDGEPLDQMTARLPNGDGFRRMNIIWDSRDNQGLFEPRQIGLKVEDRTRLLYEQGKHFRVVVYEVAT